MPRSSIISSLTRRSAAVLLAPVSPYCATGATTTSTTTCARTDLWRVHGELRRWKKTTTWLAQRHSSKHKIRADRRCTAALGSHGHAGAVERARARRGRGRRRRPRRLLHGPLRKSMGTHYRVRYGVGVLFSARALFILAGNIFFARCRGRRAAWVQPCWTPICVEHGPEIVSTLIMGNNNTIGAVFRPAAGHSQKLDFRPARIAPHSNGPAELSGLFSTPL